MLALILAVSYWAVLCVWSFTCVTLWNAGDSRMKLVFYLSCAEEEAEAQRGEVSSS